MLNDYRSKKKRISAIFEILMKCFKLVFRGFSHSSYLFLSYAKKAARFIKLEILDIEKTE